LPFLVMATIPREQPTGHVPILRAFKEGVAYAWNLVPVRMLLPVVALVSFMATPYQALMPIFAAEVFGGGADMLGFLMGAAGLGGLVGIGLLASRRELRGMLRWIAAACFCAGAALTVFAYSSELALSVPMLMLAGTGIVVAVNGISTVTMTIVEERMRGRVMSFYTMAFLGMYPVGGLVAGALASWIGAMHALALGGVCCMLCALWLWTRLPGLRVHLRPIYVKLGVITE
jgi:MFS family permease